MTMKILDGRPCKLYSTAQGLTERLNVAKDLADDAQGGAILSQVVQDDSVVVVEDAVVDVLQSLQSLGLQLGLENGILYSQQL